MPRPSRASLRIAALASGNERSDEDLVAAILQGEDRLEELMRRHNERVHRIARSVLRDASEAEDVAQEAWVRAFVNLHQFERRARFSTWLSRIAFNEALARQRKRALRVPLDTMPELVEEEEEMDPESALARRRLLDGLERAVESLPDKLRVAYVLRDVQGLSTRESARTLGVSSAVIKVRLHRARAALRRKLGEAGVIDPNLAFPFGAERCDRLVAAATGRLGYDSKSTQWRDRRAAREACPTYSSRPSTTSPPSP